MAAGYNQRLCFRPGADESIFGLRKSLKIRAGGPVKDNPIPTWFLAPIDGSKFPAQARDSNGKTEKSGKYKKGQYVALFKEICLGGGGRGDAWGVTLPPQFLFSLILFI